MTREEKLETARGLKVVLADGRDLEALTILKTVAAPEDDYLLQAKYARIAASMSFDKQELRPVRLALLGSSTLDHFAGVLKFWLAANGLNAEVFLSEFSTVRQTVLDPGSQLYRFNPDIVWIFTNYMDVRLDIAPNASKEGAERAVQQAVNECRSLWNIVKSHSSAIIVQNNADTPAERVFQNFEGSTVWGKTNLYRRFNVELAVDLPAGIVIFDYDHLSSLYGKQRWLDPKYWFHSKHAFALDATGVVAYSGAKLVAGIKGLARKCIILDLDNTLWGGVIGDDGIEGIHLGNGADGEAFVKFQEYLSALRSRGIILAVCSKNEELAAKEPFLRHPDMRLSLTDIAVFRANWKNKADNIRDIAEALNLGLDALVFIDDNPAERDLVRSVLPEVAVLEMPSDPAEYVRALDAQLYFETMTFSQDDAARAQQYRENAVRSEFQQQFTDLSEYLIQLQMEASVGGYDDFHGTRMAQLINKSNQFHLTGTRYSEVELSAIAQRPESTVRYYALRDRFGDNGLVSVVILNRKGSAMEIDTWVMSCRVLSRTMEEFICADVISLAVAGKCRILQGRYVPTKKNKLVAGLYARLEFEKSREDIDGTTHWSLRLDKDTSVPVHYIKPV